MQDDQNLLQQQGLQQLNEESKKIPLIYCWGRNQNGELGVPGTKVAMYPSVSKSFKGGYAREIATARDHTVVLNDEGKIYLAGSLLFNKIAIDSQNNNFREFKLHQQMAQYVVKKIACGDFHTLALIDDGTIFSWGGTLWDKTGHKSGGISRMQKLVGQHIVDIACGDFHSVALNSIGQIYSWGGGSQNKNKGQLGHLNKKDVPHPEEIKFFKDRKVVKIACGHYHTMVITESGELYAFGEGRMGQLGTGGKQDCSTPKKVKIVFEQTLQDYFRSGINCQTRIQQMALGGQHSLLLTNKGTVYACGYGSQGQLGLGQGQSDNKYQPFLIKSLLGKHIVMVAAGAFHSLALSANHDVYSCGYNAKGQLGIGEEKTVTIWTHITKLSGKNVGKIYAGGDHSWAVIDEITPFIKDYQPPSPIKVTFDQATIIKHNEGSRQEKSGISNNSMDEILVSLTPLRKLELIITQVEMSHRFVHFVVKDGVGSIKNKIQEYISYVYENEKKGMRFHKVSEDCEIVDGKGKLMLKANPKGTTIMMICELTEPATEYLSPKINRTVIDIGQIIIMESSMLKNENGRIPVHNMWFFKFHEIFDEIVETARFIQLRPK